MKLLMAYPVKSHGLVVMTGLWKHWHFWQLMIVLHSFLGIQRTVIEIYTLDSAIIRRRRLVKIIVFLIEITIFVYQSSLKIFILLASKSDGISRIDSPIKVYYVSIMKY